MMVQRNKGTFVKVDTSHRRASPSPRLLLALSQPSAPARGGPLSKDAWVSGSLVCPFAGLWRRTRLWESLVRSLADRLPRAALAAASDPDGG